MKVGVGIIMYDIVCSRLDLTYAISIVNQFMDNLGQVD